MTATINDIPPEVLDKILSKLGENELLKCRLVCSQWKEAMGRILEERVLSLTTIWNIKEFNATESLIPNLWMKFNFDEEATDQVVFCPPSVSRHTGNPFPTSSLQLGLTIKEGKSSHPFGRDAENVAQFFGQFGHYLTCLVLDGYYASPHQFCELLAKLPNLKTLTLAGVVFQTPEGKDFDRKSCTLPPLTQLTHLRFINLGTSICGEIGVPPFLWIMEKYGEQLVGLFVEGKIFKFEDDLESLSKEEMKFSNLKLLKISPMNKSVFRLIQSAPLTHIHVMVINYGNEVKMEELLTLIDRFSQTLVYLRIPTQPDSLDVNVGRVTFPFLKKLAISYPLVEEKMKMVKKFLLPKFPVVEKLEFICYNNVDDSSEGAANEIKGAELWKEFPALKIISVFDDEIMMCSWKQNGKSRVIWSRKEPINQ